MFWELFMGIIVSTVGMFYFRAGRKNLDPVRLICGATMCIVPWLVTNVLALIAITLVLAFVPTALERFG